MRSGIEITMKLPRHPSLVPLLLGVVDAVQGCIDKFILPFIVGKQLSDVTIATAEQKASWKAQISEVISLLHLVDISCGDGSQWNVMIDGDSDRAVLIDFGSGCCEGCEHFDPKLLKVLQRTDLEALDSLTKFIDGLTQA